MKLLNVDALVHLQADRRDVEVVVRDTRLRGCVIDAQTPAKRLMT